MEIFGIRMHYIAAIVGGVTDFLFGAWDLPLQILLTAIVLDYVSGMLKAFYLGEVSSRVGYKGLIKKVGILFTIVVANLTDLILGLHIFRSAICMFFCMNELISVLENISALGIPIPDILKDKLIQTKGNSENSKGGEK
ncbi:MAG: phage holin family protein [Peptostreptococcaceae bacterium]|nr:phage holin family protein [Peptostreptococcaceae bacterium]